jgi:predicted nucleic acid-binding protein
LKYLVDANVLSEPTRADPDPAVVNWLRANERDIVVDPIILGEMRFGINLLPGGNRKSRLERWFSEGIERIACLSWSAATGIRWARLLADLRSHGLSMPVKDSLIATTALVHGLIMTTRNVTDFAKADVEIYNPFSG